MLRWCFVRRLPNRIWLAVSALLFGLALVFGPFRLWVPLPKVDAGLWSLGCQRGCALLQRHPADWGFPRSVTIEASQRWRWSRPWRVWRGWCDWRLWPITTIAQADPVTTLWIPLWIPGSICVAMSLLQSRKREVTPSLRCERCSYDLHGLMSPECPECGYCPEARARCLCESSTSQPA